MTDRLWLRRTGPFALAAVLTGFSAISCGPSHDDARPKEPACIRDKKPFSLSAAHYAGVGKPGKAKGTSRPFVVIFDENHASRAGQVEMAIMLNRLYSTAGLRHLALEGSVVEDAAPDLTWFSRLPDKGNRTAVALEALKQGEVSAAEFAAMVLPGFRLHPIEHKSEYRAELSNAASDSYTGYLMMIAATTMTPAQNEKANGLLAKEKYNQAIRFIIDTDPWTSERYKILQRRKPVASNEERLKLGAELTERAEEVGADVTDYRDDLQEAQTFFRTVSKRSKTMAAETTTLAKKRMNDCAPIAMDIGAAHTAEVADLLRRRKMSYAVLSPSALSSHRGNDSLSTEAYDRKLKGQSVDPAGAVGAFLDGRRKPRPISQTEWFKTKAQLQYATVVIARAAAVAGGSGKPPFGLTRKQLGTDGPDPSHINVDLSTIGLVPSHTGDKKRHDVVFKVTLTAGNTTLWVRTHATDLEDPYPDSVRTLEEALKEVRKDLREEHSVPGKKPSKKSVATDIAPGIKAAFAKEKSDLGSLTLS